MLKFMGSYGEEFHRIIGDCFRWSHQPPANVGRAEGNPARCDVFTLATGPSVTIEISRQARLRQANCR